MLGKLNTRLMKSFALFIFIFVSIAALTEGAAFSDTILSPNNYFTRSVLLGDLDDDGHLDVAEANNYFTANRIYINQENGSFTESAQALNADASYGFGMADLDNDGYLDLISGNNNRPGSPKIDGAVNRIYLNDGSGNFALHESTAEFDSTISIGIGDIDNDGDMDYIGGCYDRITIYKNNGSAHFELTQILNSNEEVNSIAVGDIDNDGDLDFAAGIEGANRIYKNNGKGQFSSFQVFDYLDKTRDIKLVDVDNDNDLDLFCGNELYWNETSGEEIIIKEGFSKKFINTKAFSPSMMLYWFVGRAFQKGMRMTITGGAHVANRDQRIRNIFHPEEEI